ncbi:tetratricopeptide repeat protein 39A-like isoform X2 [Tubulanus polymorphus]|uniref:tetratricopeptide repeat protein 39A-like isoform X2 n=1 Tax=Tubulanus polymorphus TaxID=672921 RepID=UPI003DA4D116
MSTKAAFLEFILDSDSDVEFSDHEDDGDEDMDLGSSIEETTVALNLFLNNKFTQAKDIMKPWAHRSMYPALGYGTIMYLQAVMTFDAADIESAIQASKRAVIVCNKHRKKTSMIGSITKSSSKVNYDDFTDEEIHAELCYAECLLERALLTFVQDENLISFVKGGLKIRQCYQSYKECQRILQHRSWKTDKMKAHFESGVRMGIGAFNLMISLLPTKILKLLEFVGFSGNKRYGLLELEKASCLQHGLRAPLCSMILISYHTVVTYVLGTADGDIEFAENMLKVCLRNYPKGALFLFFAGRIEEIKGNIDEAILRFEESIESQSEWRQFHHLCFWELMWCHCFKGDWLMAMKYAEKLCRESRWSRATYTYQKASFLMMCNKIENSSETSEHIAYLLGEVPGLKLRIAGKSLPIEKFAVKKAKRFQTQGNRLTLPALELLYVWNGFSIIGKKTELLDPLIQIVEETINEIVNHKDQYQYYDDDYCLALLLKGVCLKHKGKRFQAEMCFREIKDLEKKCKEDAYLSPWAQAELAFMLLEEEKWDDAKKQLEQVKNNYKGYALESRLHFRIHAASLKIKAHLKGAEGTPPASPSCTKNEYQDMMPNLNSPISPSANSDEFFKQTSV